MIDFSANLCRNVERQFFRMTHLVPRHELESYEEEGKRYYRIPAAEGGIQFYKSVTTIINEKADKTWLKEWRERIGLAESEAITNSCAARGRAIHDMAEKYLKGSDYWYGHGTINIIDFNKIIPTINKHVTNILGLELPLYSHRLKTAGRTDLVAEWDGEPAIVDFKTARREKFKEQIRDYFIQTTAYSMMFQEIYDLTIEKIIVIILPEHENGPQVFIENPIDWHGPVEEIFMGEL